MARPDLMRALACLGDRQAPTTDRAAAIEDAGRTLRAGGVDASDARAAISTLHRARADDPEGPLATPLIEALAGAVGLRIGGDPRRAPDAAWGLPALLGQDAHGALEVARSTEVDAAGHAVESFLVDCVAPDRARALAERLAGARPPDVSWQVDGERARVRVTRPATQRSATAHWQELGALALPVDRDGLARPLDDDDVAARLDRYCDELTLGGLGALGDRSPLSQAYVDLIDYVYGVAETGVRACGLPSLRRVVTSGDDLAHVRALMVDDLGALTGVVAATAAELGMRPEDTRITTDDDVFTVRGAGDAGERRREFGGLLGRRLQEAGYGHELHVRPIVDGWEGQVQAYTTRARVEELARANVMFLHDLRRYDLDGRARTRFVYLGRAGGSVFLADHVERTLAGHDADARVLVLSRHTAPPRLLARVRDLIDAALYGDDARARGAFSHRAVHGETFDDAVLRGLDAAMASDPALASEVQALHDLAVDAGLLDGLGPGAELLVVDERGHGTFPLMLAHALARAPRRAGPAVRVRWFVGGCRSPMTDLPRLDPARLAADFGWSNPGRVIEAASWQAEHVPQPLAGPRYRGRDVAPLGLALELDSLRVRAGALVKNLWLYDGYLRGHAELALIPLAAARDDARADPATRELAARRLAARLAGCQAGCQAGRQAGRQADLYGIRVTNGS